MHALGDGLTGQILLPFGASAATALPQSPAHAQQHQHQQEDASSPCLAVNVEVTHPDVASVLAEHVGAFWVPEGRPAPQHFFPLAARDVKLHAGPPARLGFPKALEIEQVNWAEAVMRGEAHAYNQYIRGENLSAATGGGGAGAAPSSPVRWVTQQMLDGFVSCRVHAHTGVTTAAMLNARHTAQLYGRHIPAFDVSPYYGASALLDQWCLFGELDTLLHKPASHGAAPHHDHILRVLELAIGSALLSSFGGVWLSGAVVARKSTGDLVLILGPARSGKTTLALHALAASPDTALVAAERFFLCGGAQLPHLSAPADATVAVGVPSQIGVGVGAILGTLQPNPFLSQHVRAPPPFLGSPAAVAQLLQNSDGAIWNMEQKYEVDLMGEGDVTSSRWMPAAAGTLRGIVLLDWSVEELYETAARRVEAVAGQVPLERDGWTGEVEPLLSTWGIARDHYLLRSVYAADAALPTLSQMVSEQRDAAVVRVRGAVDFALGTKVVCRLLGL